LQQEIPSPDPQLSAEEAALVSQLTDAQVTAIDSALMSHATLRGRKLAMLVGLAMSSIPNRAPGIPDLFYAQRVRKLVADGRLEAEGNLAFMRFSEVRLPQSTNSAS
jgi:Protein of unknown function